MKVKICGITNIDDAKICTTLGADAVGFIFYKESKRYLSPEDAREIIKQLPPFISKVGVFVNEDVDIVNSIANRVGLNFVQLHGDETPEYLQKVNYPIIKAFRVDKDFDFTKLRDYDNCSFLLDSFHKEEYGGTGQKFGWEKIPNELRCKIILAGGVSSKNIDQIKNEINPYAIDISSSVEISPGIKDHEKLKQIFTKINDVRNK